MILLGDQLIRDAGLAVFELVKNAYDADASEVSVQLFHVDDVEEGEIVVEDDGEGIAENQVEHLLQRGVRGDERVQGHGIGLAIVQDLVRAYRGELSVGQSPTLGGAAFRVRIKGS